VRRHPRVLRPTACFRLLLWLFPPSFRREYGEEMTELFQAYVSRARAVSRREMAGLWLSTVLDITAAAAREWRRPNPHQAEHQHTGAPMIDRLVQDVRYSARRLAAAPGYTLTALTVLALGIGANAAVFSMVDAVALKPRPFVRPHELVRVYQDSDEGRPDSTSYPAYLDMAAMPGIFAEVSAIGMGNTAALADDATGVARRAAIEYATSSYLPMLGLRPSIGRWFEAAEDLAGGPPAAVATAHAWRERFGSDPGIIGRRVRLNGRDVTIVGVGPEGYGGLTPGIDADFWLSMSSTAVTPYIGRAMSRRTDHPFMVVARLAPGVGRAQAQAAMNVLADRIGREFPETDRGRRITVFGFAEIRIHPEVDAFLLPTAGVVMVIAGLVLLVACSNLANLLLARGSARGREIAIRLAIGASRPAVTRLLMIETLMLSIAGGALGLVAARWAVSVAGAVLPPAPISGEWALTVDARVLVFTAGLSLVTGLAFGALPAFSQSRAAVLPRLTDPDDNANGAGRRRRFFRPRQILVGAQVAVSLVLIVAAALVMQSVGNARGADIGVDTGRLAVITVDAGQAGYTGARGIATLADLRDRVSALPGVTSAARTTRLPLTPFGPSTTLEIEGYRGANGTNVAELPFAAVDPSYFETAGIRLLHGRLFTDADGDRAEPVAVVSRAMAMRYWGSEDAVGRRYSHQSVPGSSVRVVGVVSDAAIVAPAEPPRSFVYRPYAQMGGSRAAIVARTDRDPSTLALAQAVRAVDPKLPIVEAGTMASHVNESLAVSRSAASLLTAFGALAVALAIVDLYSVVSFSVSRRRAEMGVRMALGARGGQIVSMVIRETLGVVGAGVAAGLGLAALATPVIGSLLVGVRPIDVPTFAGAAVAFALAATAAAWLPARRASRASVVAALRID
jgi:predicted permease